VDFIKDGAVIQGREITPEEQAEREQADADAEAQRQAEAEDQAAKQAARDSANEKLSGWGLTAAEIAAILSA
jgi:hypothetical protein